MYGTTVPSRSRAEAPSTGAEEWRRESWRKETSASKMETLQSRSG